MHFNNIYYRFNDISDLCNALDVVNYQHAYTVSDLVTIMRNHAYSCKYFINCSLSLQDIKARYCIWNHWCSHGRAWAPPLFYSDQDRPCDSSIGGVGIRSRKKHKQDRRFQSIWDEGHFCSSILFDWKMAKFAPPQDWNPGYAIVWNVITK